MLPLRCLCLPAEALPFAVRTPAILTRGRFCRTIHAVTGAIPPNIPASDSAPYVDSAAPPWHLIHFDVLCARCGHDLRGQSEPICPACRFEFDWSVAAPLEELTCGHCNYHLYGLSDSRCPECGTAVDWNEALLRYRRREKPLFEYRWRDRPVRSFINTWLLACRPSRLWQRVSIHDDPALRPLVVWATIVIILVAILSPIGFGLALWWNAYSRQIPGGPILVTISDIPEFALRLFKFDEGYFLGAAIFLYSVFSLGALLIFQQSMSICKVRRVHVVRVACYSVVALLPLFTILYLTVEYALINDFWYRSELGRWLQYSTLGILLRPFLHFGLFAAIATIAVAFAYRRYIKMPHSFWVAASSQLIAVFALAAFFSLLGRILSN